MGPEEIRSIFRNDANSSQAEYLPCVIVYALAEIAAQLAELNQNIQLLAPSNQEIQHRAVELDIAEDEKITEEQRQHQDIVNSPTSDPEKFVRCIDCGKEIPRPDHLHTGSTYICESCIPF